jgi:hypothetical protein
LIRRGSTRDRSLTPPAAVRVAPVLALARLRVILFRLTPPGRW